MSLPWHGHSQQMPAWRRSRRWAVSVAAASYALILTGADVLLQGRYLGVRVFEDLRGSSRNPYAAGFKCSKQTFDDLPKTTDTVPPVEGDVWEIDGDPDLRRAAGARCIARSRVSTGRWGTGLWRRSGRRGGVAINGHCRPEPVIAAPSPILPIMDTGGRSRFAYHGPLRRPSLYVITVSGEVPI